MAADIEAHIRRLQALRWTQEQIARAAGMPRPTVSNILNRRVSVSSARADAIRGIRIRRAPVTTEGWTDPTGSQRRLRALAVLGHTPVVLAGLLDLHVSWLYRVASGEARHISGADALRIAALYQRLVQSPERTGDGADRVRTRAARLGWYGPSAWATVDIDDPACEPDGHPFTLGPRLRPGDEQITQLAAEGFSTRQIARSLGRSPTAIAKARARLGRDAGADAEEDTVSRSRRAPAGAGGHSGRATRNA
ncbi:helix-turn-helix transcriptional regulator [Streptomyces sp. SPB074]|uniref:helix-turn-helix transcriptional regulator n=1 Tax=Streptomyces sp. (strain SPB074) TaxID=465543 RepID=UPI00017F0E70|nr:helix-turn-helix transcriptional regulator [Streptomyces sp. SPB074]EDY43938.1 conserved hypothetical protein [Streptomyces sp. SPB074]